MPKSTSRRIPAATPLLLVLAIALAAGCGFQPRGHTGSHANLPGQIRIKGLSSFTDLYRQLDRQLQLAGTEVLNDTNGSAPALIVIDTDSERRLLSVNSRNRAVEYELIGEASFALHAADGSQLIAPQTLRVLRILFQPEVRVLGSERESHLLRRDMREELAGRIIRRLAAQQGGS